MAPVEALLYDRLPTENEADLEALVKLCLEVWQRAKPSRSSVNVSISTFVPKPQTPFQWVPQLDGELIEERLNMLKARLKRPGCGQMAPPRA